jgi:hypothetical protein
MSFSYRDTKKRSGNFRDVTGLKREEFEEIVGKVRPEWGKVEREKKRVSRKKIPATNFGRQNVLSNFVLSHLDDTQLFGISVQYA